MAGIIYPTRERSSRHLRAEANQRLSRRALVSSALGLASATMLIPRTMNAQGGTATPMSAETEGSGPHGMMSMLRNVPSDLEVLTITESPQFFYVDLAQQFARLEVPRRIADRTDEEQQAFDSAVQGLAVAAPLIQSADREDVIELVGFNPYDVDHLLFVAPTLQLFRGGIDLDALPGVWETAGYRRESTPDGDEMWSAGEDGEPDLSSPIGQAGLGMLDNVAILDDGTVAFSASPDDLAAMLRASRGMTPSLLDSEGLAKVLPTLADDAVSAIGVGVGFLDGVDQVMMPETEHLVLEAFEDSDDTVGEMPVSGTAIFAVTAGVVAPRLRYDTSDTAIGSGGPFGTPAVEYAPTASEGYLQVRSEMQSESDAAQFAAVAEYRWGLWLDQSEQPYTTVAEISAAGPSPMRPDVAAIDFAPSAGTYQWTRLVLLRDLLPFVSY